jgi:hypothetical protein
MKAYYLAEGFRLVDGTAVMPGWVSKSQLVREADEDAVTIYYRIHRVINRSGLKAMWSLYRGIRAASRKDMLKRLTGHERYS